MHWSLYHQLRPLHPQKEGGSQHLCPLARWQHHELQSHRNLGHSFSPRLGLRSSHFSEDESQLPHFHRSLVRSRLLRDFQRHCCYHQERRQPCPVWFTFSNHSPLEFGLSWRQSNSVARIPAQGPGLAQHMLCQRSRCHRHRCRSRRLHACLHVLSFDLDLVQGN